MKVRSEAEREAEVKPTEKVFGSMTQIPSDPFRIATRQISGPVIAPRDLVGLSVRNARAAQALPQTGFIATVTTCVQERLAFPSLPAPRSKEDDGKLPRDAS